MAEISRDEFQNLHEDVKDVQNKVSELCGDIKVIKVYIESRESTQKKYFTVVAIIVSVISVIVGVVMKIVM